MFTIIFFICIVLLRVANTISRWIWLLQESPVRSPPASGQTPIVMISEKSARKRLPSVNTSQRIDDQAFQFIIPLIKVLLELYLKHAPFLSQERLQRKKVNNGSCGQRPPARGHGRAAGQSTNVPRVVDGSYTIAQRSANPPGKQKVPGYPGGEA